MVAGCSKITSDSINKCKINDHNNSSWRKQRHLKKVDVQLGYLSGH
jgi:hypothetical protein